MTPGTYKGLTFDGKMTNIRGNHVALVREGRAGPDVVVADGKIGGARMAVKSKKALMIRGAVSAYLAPLALDTKPDLVLAMDGVTAKTFPSLKATVAQRIIDAAKLDATQAAGLHMALDAMEEEEVDGEDEMEEMTEAEKKAKAASDKRAKDKAAKDKAAKDKAAKDAETEKAAEDDEDEDEAAEKAMDARIKMATDKAVSETIAKMEAVAKAKEDVAPHVGVVHGMDSADAIYKFALDSAGINTKGVHPSAFPAMVSMLNKPNPNTPHIAMDAKARDNVLDMFPQLARYA